MPTSPARIAANQKNAERSTGPKTEEGKNRSRLNAFRHGLAGSGDLVGPGEDRALIDHRTSAFIRELSAPGEVGELLARRAAVLSVRMESAADRELKTVAEAVQAGRDQFDDERAEQLDAWVVEAEDSGAPDIALFKLETCPEGLRYLREVWRVIRARVARDDEQAAERAAHWLGLLRTEEGTPANLLPAIDAEIARLDPLVGSPIIEEAARLVRTRRDDAGQIAGFDTSPEATLARRYEAAAERGMYRAMRAIQELRRDANPASLLPPPAALLTPPTSPTVPPTPRPVASPSPIPSLGSFRDDVLTISAGRSASPILPEPTSRHRPDVRESQANRR